MGLHVLQWCHPMLACAKRTSYCIRIITLYGARKVDSGPRTHLSIKLILHQSMESPMVILSNSHTQQRQLNLMNLNSVVTGNYHETIKLYHVTLIWQTDAALNIGPVTKNRIFGGTLLLYPDSAVFMDILCLLSNKELLNRNEVLLYVLFTANFCMYLYVELQE